MKKDEKKTKAQLIDELVELRSQITKLKAAETERERAEKALNKERNLLRTLIDNMPDYIYVKDTESRFLLVNRETSRGLGLTTPDELVGKTDFDTCPREIAEQYYADDRTVIESGQPLFNREEPSIHPETGNMHWLLTTKIPFQDSQGNIVGLVGISRDITMRKQMEEELRKHRDQLEELVEERTRELMISNEQLQREINDRKRAEEALRESEKRYRMLFESLQDVFYRTDPEGNIVLVSPSIVQLLGYTRDEAKKLNLGRNIFVHPDHWKTIVLFVKEHGSLEEFEVLLKRRDGSIVWGSMTCQWYTDKDGHILGIEGIIRDITRRKRTEETLQKRTSQLEVLHKVGLELAARLDLDVLLHFIASRAVELLGGIEGGLYLYQPDRDVLEWTVAVGPNPIPIGTILHRGEGAAGKVWETGEPLIVDDYQHWEGRAEIYNQYRFTSIVQGPVRWGDEFLGVLSVDGAPSHKFTQADVELLNLFATQAAIAIRNARLYEAERKLATQLAVVNQVARKIVSILDPDQLFQEIVMAIQQNFKYYSVGLLSLDETTGELEGQAKVGSSRNTSPPNYRQAVGVGLIGWAAETGQTLLVNDVSQDSRYIIGLSEGVLTKSELSVPLKVGGNVIGVLDIQDNRVNAFDESDRTAMETLADQVAVAIENARLYKKMQQELTERKRVEKALQHAKEVAEEAQKAAEAASQAKSNFLAHMSHELRTPLNGILGYTQILKRDKSLTEKHCEAIEIMEQSGKHLLLMINDILDLSRIEAGKLAMSLTDFHLPELVKTVGEITRIQAQQKGISLDYHLAPELQINVHGDKTRLRQILLNLIGNAVTFTKRGGVMLRVTKLGTGDSILDTGNLQPTSRIRFQIADTGIGIPSEQLKEIFEPFRQVKDSRIRSKGIGLGLAISQRLLRMMDSELHVESSVGQGSTFWFDVELPEVEHVIASTVKPSRNIIGFKRPSTTSSTGSGQDSGRTAYKILIADDETRNLTVLKDALLPLGFEIAEAVHGRDVLDKAAEFHPDAILMDLIMPEMDGFEATRQIRQNPTLQDVIVIAVSANAFEQTRQESAEAGCDDFLVKPIDIDDLLEQLRIHLHLEWLYEEESEERHVETCPETFGGVSTEQSRSIQDTLYRRDGAHPSEHIIPPSAEELAPLCELIRKGDIMGVYPQADRIERLDQKYAPFAMKIRQLAKTFRIDELEAFINHLYERGNMNR